MRTLILRVMQKHVFHPPKIKTPLAIVQGHKHIFNTIFSAFTVTLGVGVL
jgi:hypothetical protein